MTTLLIKDLSLTEELDRKAMAGVRGGMYKGYVPYWGALYDGSKRDFSFKAEQFIGQTQNISNANGNNVAFAEDIRSVVKPTQAATNNITF